MVNFDRFSSQYPQSNIDIWSFVFKISLNILITSLIVMKAIANFDIYCILFPGDRRWTWQTSFIIFPKYEWNSEKLSIVITFHLFQWNIMEFVFKIKMQEILAIVKQRMIINIQKVSFARNIVSFYYNLGIDYFLIDCIWKQLWYFVFFIM